jgi:predicted esterase
VGFGNRIHYFLVSVYVNDVQIISENIQHYYMEKIMKRNSRPDVFKMSILFIFICLSASTFAQSSYLDKEISYLSWAPLIDGKLDSNLVFLQPRTLPVIYKDEVSNPDLRVSYRIAYGAEFFYVYVEAEAEKLVYRDRAFQNGDGFHMVLAKPKSNNQPTDEFYVLACSAVNKKSMEWTRNIFWYYNVDNIFQRTSKDTKMMFAEHGGKISFELILPWKDVHPYHPWLSEGIGFNLCFVKAIGDQNKNTYKALDAQLGSENSNREYLKLKFQKPEHMGNPKTIFMLDKNNIKDDETLSGTAVTISSDSYNENLFVEINTGENDRLEYKRISYTCEKGITIKKSEIIANPIAAGGYRVDWRSLKNKSNGRTYFTSLPQFNPKIFNEEIEKVKEKISQSSYSTLKHKVYEIEKDLAEVRPYEKCGKQRIAISQLLLSIENSKKAVDDIAEKTGFVRKAYQSKLDETLQPYMVFIPKNYNPNMKYPLIVYLHGSASDETSLYGSNYFIPNDFIVLAPKGRGPSNCYSWDNAQTDISEAIDAVVGSYPIDKGNIFLSGFSMGGYGVYRTYYETPGKFKALAVFSGNPNLANQWSDDETIYPDFTQEKYLEKFKGIPMFIFHGKEDRNCSFETTQQIINKLSNAGAKVKFVSEEDKGHEAMGEETVNVFHEWIETIL